MRKLVLLGFFLTFCIWVANAEGRNRTITMNDDSSK
jgi:hypothetical protein